MRRNVVNRIPTRAAVSKTVKVALHDPDPVKRAEAAARLTMWGLPASATAIVMVAEREVYLSRPLDD